LDEDIEGLRIKYASQTTGRYVEMLSSGVQPVIISIGTN